MSIDWLTPIKTINWPQVIVGVILASASTFFIQRWIYRRSHTSEFTVTRTVSATSKDRTDITTKKTMQFQVGAKGDIRNVNFLEIIEALKQAPVDEEEVIDEETTGEEDSNF